MKVPLPDHFFKTPAIIEKTVAALVCAIYTAILALGRRRWYKKHMELHAKREV